jgi:regulator of sirC expression with transglutaminase-like and TPR domain
MVPPLPTPNEAARARVRFEDVVAKPDAELDVALGAALIARDVYPDLDVGALVGQLDGLAAPLFPGRLEALPAEEQAAALAGHLFAAPPGAGFRGNEAEYYDPKNSLLSDVLERRLGIPLTLAIVYCEVARRVGVPAHGVGFPGHFLVRIERPGAPASPLIVDPFFGGRSVEAPELRSRLERVRGEGTTDVEPHLRTASPRSILVRMLTNLKAIYLTRNERARAHLAVDRIVSLLPNAAGPLVERGLLAVQLGAREAARNDLTRALALSPSENEQRLAKTELAKLTRAPAALN